MLSPKVSPSSKSISPAPNFTESRSKVLSSIVESGTINDVKNAIKEGAMPDSKTLTLACRTRNVYIIDAVLDSNAVPDDETLTEACLANIEAVVKKVLLRGAKATDKTFQVANEIKNPEILALLKTAPRISGSTNISGSAKSPSATPVKPDMLTQAVQTGDIDIVNLSISKGALPDNQTLTWACNSGNINIVKAVLAKNAIADDETLTTAAATNIPEIVQAVIRTKGIIATERTFQIANELNNPRITALIQSAPRKETTPAKPVPPVEEPDNELTRACISGNKTLVENAILKKIRPQRYTLLYAVKTRQGGIISPVANVGAQLHRDPNVISELNEAFKLYKVGNEDFYNLEIVNFVYSQYGATPDSQTLTIAFATGNEKIVDKALSLSAKPNEETLNTAIRAALDNKSWNNSKTASKCLVYVRKALSAGARPNNKTLDLLVERDFYSTHFDMILLDVIKLGARPSTETLTQLLRSTETKHSAHFLNPIIPELLNAGAVANLETYSPYIDRRFIPTHQNYRMYMSKNRESRGIVDDVDRALWEAGLMPKQEDIDRFIKQKYIKDPDKKSGYPGSPFPSDFEFNNYVEELANQARSALHTKTNGEWLNKAIRRAIKLYPLNSDDENTLRRIDYINQFLEYGAASNDQTMALITAQSETSTAWNEFVEKIRQICADEAKRKESIRQQQQRDSSCCELL